MSKKINKKNPGNVSFQENKLRIEFKDATESILYEDISSMSNNKVSVPNMIYSGLGFLFLVVMWIIGLNFFSPDSATASVFIYIGLAGLIAGFIISAIKQKKWDDVVVETRGGKEVRFSVPEGKGIETVDSIENEKRNHS